VASSKPSLLSSIPGPDRPAGLAGASPETPRSTSDRRSEVLRGVSGVAPARQRGSQGGTSGQQGTLLDSPKQRRARVCSARAAIAVSYVIRLGYTPGLRRGVSGKGPSEHAEWSGSKGRWRWPKCRNCNTLLNQPSLSPLTHTDAGAAGYGAVPSRALASVPHCWAIQQRAPRRLRPHGPAQSPGNTVRRPAPGPPACGRCQCYPG
jgi:hypothetical protein